MAQQKQSSKKNQPEVFAFDKEKYTLLLIGLFVTALGFILMLGGNSSNPDVFNMSIFNFQRITLTPILVLAGYGVVLYTILKRPKTKQETN